MQRAPWEIKDAGHTQTRAEQVISIQGYRKDFGEEMACELLWELAEFWQVEIEGGEEYKEFQAKETLRAKLQGWEMRVYFGDQLMYRKQGNKMQRQAEQGK